MEGTFTWTGFFALVLTATTSLSNAYAQGTAFTYQGRLNSGGGPANGLYDFRFKLAEDPLGNSFAGNNYLTNAITVTNGLFITTVDFGPGLFVGSNYWLEVDVRTNNPANTLSYTPLTPLQSITPTPYAIMANSASNLLGTLPAGQLTGAIPPASLSGTYNNAVTLNNVANILSGAFAGDGSGLTNLNASQLTTGTLPLSILPSFQSPFETICGGQGNSASYLYSTICGGYQNVTGGPYSFIGGGRDNDITINGSESVVSGGYGNTNNASLAVIGGGYFNEVLNAGNTVGGGYYNFSDGTGAAIGGGLSNTNNGNEGTIAGGQNNNILVPAGAAYQGTIGGGYGNIVTNSYATVPGGILNIAGGLDSFAAGQQAQALHQGAFVWADSQNAAFASTNNDSFNVRAQGGVRFVTGGTGVLVDGQPILAGTLNPGQLSGAYTNAVSFTNSANTFAGNGINVSNVNALALNGLRATNFWQTGGNSGTTPGVNYLGTADNQPLVLSVNGARVLRLEPGAGAPNIIGGYFGNLEDNGSQGVTIGGGGAAGYLNHVSASLGTVSGGSGNVIGSNANDSTIGGGRQNEIDQGSWGAVIGGGHGNWIQAGTNSGGALANSSYATIGGGYGNTIQTNAILSTVGGGAENTNSGSYAIIGGGYENLASGNFATIGGGIGNQATFQLSSIGGGLQNLANANGGVVGGGMGNTNYGYGGTIAGGVANIVLAGVEGAIGGGAENLVSNNCATVPGGLENVASGPYSFAAGSYAQALNTGSFVWADNSSTTPFASTINNSFNLRASGGVRIASTSAGTVGVMLAAGATSWTTLSDRNAKKDFAPVDYQGVLTKLAQVPIEQWHYKWESGKDTLNIGPMAQDFIHAFYPGRDDKGISTLEFDGVELAAIQGLNQKLEARSEQLESANAELKQQNDSLEKRLARLEQIVSTLGRDTKQQ